MQARAVIAGVALTIATLSAAAAQDEDGLSDNVVGTESDWTVFADPPDDPARCWSVSIPKETVNTDFDGNPKEVVRGDIVLSVSFRPQDDVAGEVSFTGGYPFEEGSLVTAEIGDQSFKMFTQGEWAWPRPEDDAAMIEAMKGGAEILLTGRSQRDTITKDSFSLFGFTAGYELAEEYCSR